MRDMGMFRHLGVALDKGPRAFETFMLPVQGSRFKVVEFDEQVPDSLLPLLVSA